ncbi:RNA pseudouridine synthase [Endozoicomonas sp. G2_1]|uniref:RluA family pseudouridine synthase n=1 Tax=Endozoicomonas sp. G2_1 TaxID=2821091 RepID=UPI001ADBB81E|nr:RluA family pseudouridine synthase [Endozoicomonas sp. G2_1]MBO9489199.1 RNA pseudouridine synthase [Endozoicomonas sp. G2_1]
MLSDDSYFTLFAQSVDHIAQPSRFTFPFYYQPHQLAVLAAEQLQQHLKEQKSWHHNFGLNEDDDSALASGKMFGVLVVKNSDGELGYLLAFSGKLADSSDVPGFVPPVFDIYQDKELIAEQNLINQLNSEIASLSAAPELAALTARLSEQNHSAEQEISEQQAHMVERRKQRKAARARAKGELACGELSSDQLTKLEISLAGQSVSDKKQLLSLKELWREQISTTSQQLDSLVDAIDSLKQQRKQRSNQLQQQFFSRYQFLNAQSESRDLADVFREYANHPPPAGAGDCAAPKLLQYAYLHQLTPIALAEFWWGKSPSSEIRRHRQFYPSCQGKCFPILTHMLKGLAVDDNPLLANSAQDKELEIVYQDDDILVVNKPAELLSVPGKNIQDSVYSRIKQTFPDATGSLIVHRLDMSTSGLMVLALNPRAHKHLQKQFINRVVQKRYLALLDGVLNVDEYGREGTINLPLIVDFDDRPRQKVCQQTGKNAETYWQLIEVNQQQSRVHLYPKTGRTHQLRVHCAHPKGLNLPMIGDDLYGKNSAGKTLNGIREQRLHLHAEHLSFIHPISQQPLTFEVSSDF